ncbi:MAG: SIMPL domain-containing protein [Candidatus Limnocylindrales bacterium]|nr:SIMPL domain-containing protein [Candidatus Limnocylindrales bacterium]
MSQPIRTAAALALGALVVAIATLAVRPGPAVGAPSADGEPALHTITVSATGSVTLVPDVARVSVGVTVTKPTVKAARDAAGTSMNAIIASLKALGIDEKDMKTISIDLSPQYNNSPTPKVIGYRMSEQLQVTVRDLDKAGDVVDTATANGATDVNGLWFEVGDPARAMDGARAGAIAQARASAQAMASAAGVSLGAVVSISDSSISYPGPYYGAAMRDTAGTPVQPGTQDVQVAVTVIFEIN